MHLFVSAGEPSGDLHAANLIRSLQAHHPGILITGFGGPRSRAYASGDAHADRDARLRAHTGRHALQYYRGASGCFPAGAGEAL